MEFLAGKAANSGYAALNLAKRGYYDQALTINRTLGEIANLLALFGADAAMLDRWKTADERTRKKEFQPFRVRDLLVAKGFALPVNAARYGRLSVYSIHATPDGLPQAHGPRAQAVTSPVYQPAGFLLALNELALAVAFITVFASALIQLPSDVRETLKEVARGLGEKVGAVDIMVDGRPWSRPTRLNLVRTRTSAPHRAFPRLSVSSDRSACLLQICQLAGKSVKRFVKRLKGKGFFPFALDRV